MAIALIALGSNVGDSVAHLRAALDLLGTHVEILKVSEIYETEPMYVENQPKFQNAAVKVHTDLGPNQLLKVLKQIETEVGRQLRERNGPREVDLDLIAYGSLIYRFEHIGEVKLTVPHPKTPERRFVLAPLNDIAPDFNLPGLGVVSELLQATKDQAASVQRREDVALSLHRV